MNATEFRTQFHLAPDGDDGAAGTAHAPFATLTRARDAARQTVADGGLPKGGLTIWIHDGLYQLDESFILDERDSGTESSPITYRAVEDARVRISGGCRIPPTSLAPVESSVQGRLDERARDQVLQVDLKTLGVTEVADPPLSFRGSALPELFAAGRRMSIARWPNEGWGTMGEIIDRGSRTGQDDVQKGGTFVYEGDRPSRWSVEDGVWLQGYWCWDWYEESIKVAAIDTTTHSITLAAPHPYGIGYDPDFVWADSPRRFFALNLIEELDEPGEWFLDTSSLVLYLWPRDESSNLDDDIVLSLLQDPLVAMESASHVSFEGITFETSRGSAIEIREGSDNRIAGCTFRNLGHGAVAVSGGTNHLVVGCDIHDVGSFGISLTGGDRQSLTPGGHTALNNHVYRFARLQRTYAGAVHLNGVGNRAAHNLIHDAPHLAMEFIGNDHLIEYNHIHHVAQETGDVGALYTGRDWTARGNVIRYNFMHDLLGPGVVGSMGVYLDDCICGTEVYGNVIHKATYALHSGGGRDNVFRNNIVTESKHAVHIDTRCADIEAVRGKMPIYWERLEAVPYQQPPWSERYPELVNILDDDLGMPKRNVVERNVAVACDKWLHTPHMEPYLAENHIDNNLDLATYEEAGFVDAAGLDFRLREDSRVFSDLPGFEQIPFDKIGLYQDEMRKRLPRQSSFTKRE
jgi:hypothetical protein